MVNIRTNNNMPNATILQSKPQGHMPFVPRENNFKDFHHIYSLSFPRLTNVPLVI